VNKIDANLCCSWDSSPQGTVNSYWIACHTLAVLDHLELFGY
jgi:hypothetical protein